MSTSLDILEESLDRIYACRKRLLQAKIARKYRNSTHKPVRKLPEIETEYFPTTYRASTNAAVDEDDDDEDGSNDVLPTDVEKGDLPKLTTREADDMAKAVFKEFQAEVNAWIEEDVVGMKRNDSEYREDYADYLTEKFMCNRLDPLPSSEIVSSVRKNLSGIIENFASDGALPKNFKGQNYLAEVLKSVKSKNHQNRVGDAGGDDRRRSNDSSAGSSPAGKLVSEPSSKAAVTAASSLGRRDQPSSSSNVEEESGLSISEKKKLKDAERLAQEKQKMKDQYEAYMKKTKQPATVVGVSAATAAASILGPLIKTKAVAAAGASNITSNADSVAAVEPSPAAATNSTKAASNSLSKSKSNTAVKKDNSSSNDGGAVKLQTPAPLSVAPGGGNSNIEEAQQLNDDIRSLITSLQSKPNNAIPPPKK